MGAVEAPAGRHAISVNGKPYFVDDEAIADLKAKGIPFDTSETWHQKQTETASDFARGGVHGASFGLADTKFGEDNQSVAQRLGGDDYDTVKERSPNASLAGDVMSSVLVPVPGAGAFGATKGVGGFLARAGVNAAVGAGTGGLRAAAEGEDISDAALMGGALGGVGGGLAEGAGRVATGAKNLLSKGLNSAADSALVRGVFGVGGTGDQLKKIAAKFGLDNLPEGLAAKIREMVPSESFLGKNRSQYSDELAEIASQEGPQIGYLREKMGGNGPGQQGLDNLLPDEFAKVQENLQKELSNISRRTDVGDEEYKALQRNLERMKEHPDPQNLTDWANIKSDYQAGGHTGALGTVPEKAGAQAAATIGSEMKQGFDRTLQYAKDGTREAYEKANDRFGLAKALHNQIDPKAYQEQMTSNAAGLAAMAQAALTNGVLGGVAGAVGGEVAGEHATAGGVGGAVLGALHGATMASNTGTRNFMTQLLAQPKAMDALSNIMRASGKKLGDLDLQALSRYVRTHMGQAGGLTGYAAEKR